MRFKLLGVVFLLFAAMLAGQGLLLAWQSNSNTLLAEVAPLVAVFLALTVRVLQAEKHHRDLVERARRREQELARPERSTPIDVETLV